MERSCLMTLRANVRRTTCFGTFVRVMLLWTF